MEPFEIPEGMVPVEDIADVSELEVFETPELDSQAQEIMELIFPADRNLSVDVYAYVSRVGGKSEINAVMNRKISELLEAGLEEYEIRSIWTVPTAAQMDSYRQECSEYQAESQAFMINNLKIRDMIVAHHLKELLFPPKYKPFPFKYTRPDRLSGDTVKRIKSMHSGIYDVLYTKFTTDACLVV